MKVGLIIGELEILLELLMMLLIGKINKYYYLLLSYFLKLFIFILFIISVAQFIAYGGSYHSYYMWYGGNNFGSFAASGVTTMYANDVILHHD